MIFLKTPYPVTRNLRINIFVTSYSPFLTTSSIKTNLLSHLLLNQYPEFHTSAKFSQASPIAQSMEPFVYQALSATLTMGTDH